MQGPSDKGEGARKCSVRFPGSDDLLAGFARGSKGQVKGELPEKGSIHLGNFQKELTTGRDGFHHISDLRLASERSKGPGCVPLRPALPAFCVFLVREPLRSADSHQLAGWLKSREVLTVSPQGKPVFIRNRSGQIQCTF